MTDDKLILAIENLAGTWWRAAPWEWARWEKVGKTKWVWEEVGSMAESQTDDDAPTATEFIPAEENGLRYEQGPGVRYLQATGDKGMEIVNEEPSDEPIHNHVYVCDQCGQSEDTESAMGLHLWGQHE